MKKTRNWSRFIQAIFWLLLYAFQLSMTANFLEYHIASIVSLLNTLLGMVVYYMNMYYLFPRYFITKKYILYVLINFCLTIVLCVLFFYIDRLIVSEHRIVAPREPRLGPLIHIIRAFTYFSFIFVVSLIFSLIRQLQIQQVKEKELSEDKLNTEIRLLKAQISPHFIFNALNNIYSLSYSKSDNAPDAVLKLSQMLRYVLHECNKDEVSLESEIKYINNFISFQQMKTAHLQCINFNTKQADESFRIAPMLLIPFVENSFKYSKIENHKEICIDIEISANEHELTFRIKNNIPEHRADSGSGMGIKNVKNRLQLTYPNRHSFEVKDENNTFEVTLKIKRA